MLEDEAIARAGTPDVGDGGRVWRAFSPLRHRNFRLLWTGLLVSQTGSWMQFIALGYLVDHLTKAPIYLGLLGLSAALPRLLFAVLGGVAADRMDRRRVLLSTNLMMMGSAVLLWILAATGRIQVWHVLLVGAFNSLTQSFDVPARHSMVPSLVREHELLSAVSLTTMALNGSGIFGPSLGGLVIALAGVAGCFALNALSYTAVLAALLLMDIPGHSAAPRESFGEDLREGFALLRRHPDLLTLLGLVATLNFFGRPYVRLMPAVAREALGVGPTGLGVLQAAPAVGTILAVFVVGAITGNTRTDRTVWRAALSTGILVALFGISRWFWISVPLLVLVGTATAVAQAAANTLLQTSVRPDQRGRIMGLYSMVTFGMFALGTLPLGALGGVLGVGPALTLGGLVVVGVVSVLMRRSPRVAGV